MVEAIISRGWLRVTVYLHFVLLEYGVRSKPNVSNLIMSSPFLVKLETKPTPSASRREAPAVAQAGGKPASQAECNII
jgi:hypothetical protein